MSDNLTNLQTLTLDLRNDYTKAKNGNKAASTRVRNAMQTVKQLAQDIRTELLSARH